MDDEVGVIAAAAIYLISAYNYYVSVYRTKVVKKKRQKRRCSMENQLTELLQEPESKEFQNFVRMSDSNFEYLLQNISPVISKQDTDFRESIPAKIRLAVTLRYLATGDSYRSLHYTFKISSQLISQIIPEVCQALIDVLKDTVKIPTSPEEWLTVARGFRFPHCVGALDGKHIKIQSPPKSGSEYYNYKGDFSIVLLGLVVSNYCFLFADVGAQGRISDGGVLRQTILWKKIIDKSINFPPPCPLPDTDIEFPYVILGDGAFALHTNILKPYPGNHETGTPERVFNQILSGSRVGC
ncbi:hypothetical protein ACJJTC_014074 [Scirpophaga incertulas]